MTTAERQVQDHVEKNVMAGLRINYFRAIDDKCFDLAIVEATFTTDARIIRPNGSATVGHNNILDEHAKSFAWFKVTHHVTTDYIINIDDRIATLRANLTAMHLWADNDTSPALNSTHFLAGVVRAKAIKVDTNRAFVN